MAARLIAFGRTGLLLLCLIAVPALAESRQVEAGHDQQQTRADWIAYLEHIAASHHLLGIPPNVAAESGFRLEREAETVVSVGRGLYGRNHFLAPEAADAYRMMFNAAQADGIELHLVSSFRSVNDQTHLIQRRLSDGRSLERILRGTALPGYSQHHTGCAVDFVNREPGVVAQSFRESTAYDWLRAHAAEYGFRESYTWGNRQGVIPEPWHWFFADCNR